MPLKQLTMGLVYQAHQYYALDDPAWPDDVYDQQYRTLLETEAVEGALPFSPSINVGCACPTCKPAKWAPEHLDIWNSFGYARLVASLRGTISKKAKK